MKKILLLSVLAFAALLNNGAYAQVNSNSFKEKFDEYRSEMLKDFDTFRNESAKQYKQYTDAIYAEYKEFLSSIKKIWGEGGVVEDTKTTWVEYSKDLKSRSIVDFENGKIDVEIIVDNSDVNDSTLIEQRLADAVNDLLSSKGQTLPFESEVEKQEPISQTPILEGLVDFSIYDINESEVLSENELQPKDAESKKMTPPVSDVKDKISEKTEGSVAKSEKVYVVAEKVAKEAGNQPQKESDKNRITVEKAGKIVKYDVEAIIKAIVEQSKKLSHKVKGEDKKERTMVKIEMALVSDNLSKNAAVYKDYVEQYSKKFEIEQPLIFAVMEQESYFNPKAKSWVPAYGLMQLVPTSGGYDAYKYVYKNDWIPTPSYLYIPHQNIELGTAYLRILMNQFASVKNPECRRLCVIASYNTGAGNVSRAFTGNTNLKMAIPIINEYSYQQLYEYLTNMLGSEEARKYVSGVSRRREKYMK